MLAPHSLLPVRQDLGSRQWPEVYDLRHTFLHVARDSRMAVGFFTRATWKNVRQNLIPRATAYWAAALAPRLSSEGPANLQKT